MPKKSATKKTPKRSAAQLKKAVDRLDKEIGFEGPFMMDHTPGIPGDVELASNSVALEIVP